MQSHARGQVRVHGFIVDLTTSASQQMQACMHPQALPCCQPQACGAPVDAGLLWIEECRPDLQRHVVHQSVEPGTEVRAIARV